jgi:hypothetical protein
VTAAATPDTLGTALRADGFVRLPGTDLCEGLGADVATAWPAFAASWGDLPLDEYMADGGRYRRRRHTCFTVTSDGVVREPHQPHYQSRDYNTLNGGIERWFAPVLSDVAAHPGLVRLMTRFGDVFTTAEGIAVASARWFVEVHQFRIEARPDAAGLPTPEGMHRDGVDWVAVTLVRRENVVGGVTSVADAEGRPLGSFTLDAPLDTVLLDDHRVWHGVTPLVPLDPSAPAYRDVLVLTFATGGGGHRPITSSTATRTPSPTPAQ